MERKTKVNAEEGKHDIHISREFDLPVDLLFKAHVDPEIFEQWMSHEYGTTKVLKLECKNHGGWQFQTVDAQGNVLFQANGVIHEFVQDQKITRTFEMNNTPFAVQLEFLEFVKLGDDTSKLNMQIVFKTVELRDQLLKQPFAMGLNMAHNRLQEVVGKLK
ncbi:SRPBCC domain-containing protein [Longitalea luteola]|uniref:SRPBCC domain-containing protein n=1 Tax=Longitalea luteola TaxID=2812563 RepID=UPI001A958353|nr:SRPBCC domain-containing protein [Longitalea luteola]